jgi:opacity protein-like surface antigen
MRHLLLTTIAGAALAVAMVPAAFAADLLVKAPAKKAPLGASGYLELYTGWENRQQTFSDPSFQNESDDGWLLGGAGRVNLWINPSFSVQFDAQGEGTQFTIDSSFCTGNHACNVSEHTYLLAGHATYRDPMLGGIGVFAGAGDMTVPSTNCDSAPLSCNGSVRFALGGGEAFVNWNQFTFYVQGGFGGTVGDNLSIFGESVTAPFLRGTARFYPTSNWLLEGTVLGAWATIKPFDAGDFSDQSTNVLLWRVKAETLVHPNLSVYVAYQGSQTDLSCNGSFCSPSGLSIKGTDNRVMGGIRLWLDRDNLRNNDLTGAPLDIINPLGVAFAGFAESD